MGLRQGRAARSEQAKKLMEFLLSGGRRRRPSPPMRSASRSATRSEAAAAATDPNTPAARADRASRCGRRTGTRAHRAGRRRRGVPEGHRELIVTENPARARTPVAAARRSRSSRSKPAPAITFDRVGVAYGRGQEARPAHWSTSICAWRRVRRWRCSGPSGSGKSTALKALAGFVRPTSGAVRLAAATSPTCRPPSGASASSLQSYALFPHMRVAENVRSASESHRVPRGGDRRRGWPRRWTWSAWPRTGSACLVSFPAVSSSGWRSPALWRSGRRCCCSTSRWPRWTRSCASPCSPSLQRLQGGAAGHGDALRHPRSGGGAGAGRPDRGDDGTPDSTTSTPPRTSGSARRPVSPPPSSAARTCCRARWPG